MTGESESERKREKGRERDIVSIYFFVRCFYESYYSFQGHLILCVTRPRDDISVFHGGRRSTTRRTLFNRRQHLTTRVERVSLEGISVTLLTKTVNRCIVESTLNRDDYNTATRSKRVSFVALRISYCCEISTVNKYTDSSSSSSSTFFFSFLFFLVKHCGETERFRRGNWELVFPKNRPTLYRANEELVWQ